jgi:hypothetical protein
VTAATVAGQLTMSVIIDDPRTRGRHSGRYAPEMSTTSAGGAQRRRPSRRNLPRTATRVSGLALEVRDLGGLVLDLVLRVAELLLRFALALLARALAAQRRVVGEVAGRLGAIPLV